VQGYEPAADAAATTTGSLANGARLAGIDVFTNKKVRRSGKSVSTLPHLRALRASA
jgi:hypothetical protein